MSTEEIVLFIGLILIWELLWKGLALWQCGKHVQKKWYVTIFLLNTLGILPILYLVFFRKKDELKGVSNV